MDWAWGLILRKRRNWHVCWQTTCRWVNRVVLILGWAALLVLIYEAIIFVLAIKKGKNPWWEVGRPIVEGAERLGLP